MIDLEGLGRGLNNVHIINTPPPLPTYLWPFVRAQGSSLCDALGQGSCLLPLHSTSRLEFKRSLKHDFLVLFDPLPLPGVA